LSHLASAFYRRWTVDRQPLAITPCHCPLIAAQFLLWLETRDFYLQISWSL
jgi:hypothetical protein